MGAAFALTLPGLVVLLVAVAFADQGKGAELAQRHTVELVGDDQHDGAPPRSRVDLDGGVAHLRLRE